MSTKIESEASYFLKKVKFQIKIHKNVKEMLFSKKKYESLIILHKKCQIKIFSKRSKKQQTLDHTSKIRNSYSFREK